MTHPIYTRILAASVVLLIPMVVLGQTSVRVTMRGITSPGPLTSYVVDGDAVVDTVTTLMWQRTDGGEMTWQQAKLYCDTLTIGGYNDWRLPSAHELFSIQDLTKVNPSHATVFTSTGAEYWWSIDTLVTDGSRVWSTNSGGGIGPHPMRETISAGGSKKFHVRAVRDRQTPITIPAHFIDHGDETVTDEATGLEWMQFCVPGTYTYDEAIDTADRLTHAGRTDWRLPTIKELQSLNVETVTDPSFDLQYFPCIASTRMLWTSTTLTSRSNDQAWLLQPEFGIVTYGLRTERHAVLCVRGGNTPTSVEDDGQVQTSILYPNPTTGSVSFSETMERVVVTDLAGITHIDTLMVQHCSLAMLPAGPYVVRMISHDGAVHTTLVIKH